MPYIKKVSESRYKRETLSSEISVPNLNYIENRLLEDEDRLSFLDRKITRYTESASEQLTGLSALLYPTDEGWENIYKDGWFPFSLNQNWGGAQWGNLPNGKYGDVATGYVVDNTEFELGRGAPKSGEFASEWLYKDFKVSHDMNIGAVWIKLRKIGNPSSEIYVTIERSLADKDIPGGTDNSLGSSKKISGRKITSSEGGKWYRFEFKTPVALNKNDVNYIVVCTDSHNTDNYFKVRGDKNSRYFAKTCGYSSNVPIYRSFSNTPQSVLEPNDSCFNFLVESHSDSSFLQSHDGITSGKLVFQNSFEPFNQGRLMVKRMSEFFDEKIFTIFFRMNFKDDDTNKNKTICDFVYGLDHDRIRIGLNDSGQVEVNVYQTNDSTIANAIIPPVVGTKNIIKPNIVVKTDPNTGEDIEEKKYFHDIGIIIKAENKESDYIKLFVDGGEKPDAFVEGLYPIKFDPNFKKLGTVWLGGGFPKVSATTFNFNDDFSRWEERGASQEVHYHDSGYGFGVTKLSDRPDWSFEGGADENDAFYLDPNNSILYQLSTYNTNLLAKYKSHIPLNNENGYLITWKFKINNFEEGSDTKSLAVNVLDGAYKSDIFHNNYYLSLSNTKHGLIHQYNLNDDKYHVVTYVVKGDTCYLFIDGRFVVDGINELNSTTTSLDLFFGDDSALNNAEVEWDYVKVITELFLPESINAELEEFIFWKSNKDNHMESLWNAGERVSAKSYCGLRTSSLENICNKVSLRGITTFPKVESGNDYETVDDMEMFILASGVDIDFFGKFFSDDVSIAHAGLFIDGKRQKDHDFMTTEATRYEIINCEYEKDLILRKIEVKHRKDASGSSVFDSNQRRLNVCY